ncbi:MAG TPA: hypothetical protein VD963_06600 [Phycisphaerales bacterium]|nr:hypothetical protein [Phycisphaerales bacterium]
MSHISGIGQAHDHTPAAGPRPHRAGRAEATAARPADRVELAAPELKLVGHDAVRWDLVTRVRTELAAGTYETDGKLDIAAERMTGSLDLLA